MIEDLWSEERQSSSVRLSIKRSEAREFLELLADEGESWAGAPKQAEG